MYCLLLVSLIFLVIQPLGCERDISTLLLLLLLLLLLHIRALLSMSSGKMKFDSSRWYVEASLLYFCGDHVRVSFLFCKLHILHPGSRGPSSKYRRWNKPVDIKSSFSAAPRSSLTRLRREPSVSIRKKYPLEPSPGYHEQHCFETRHFDGGRPCGEPSCKSLVQRSRMSTNQVDRNMTKTRSHVAEQTCKVRRNPQCTLTSL